MGLGHRSASLVSLTGHAASPGPGSYSVDMGSFARRRRPGTSSVTTMGTASGHQTPELSRESSPGPGAYQWDDRHQSHHWLAPKATFGRGPGHNMLVPPLSREGSPGPGDYNNLPRARQTHGGTFGRAEGHGAGFWEHDDVVQERRMFNMADINKDGKLDLEEVCAILWRGSPDMKKADIEALFSAVDKNKDGRIQFSELVDFIHSGPGSCKRSRDKIKAAFLERPASQPTPGSTRFPAAKGKWGLRGTSITRGGC